MKMIKRPAHRLAIGNRKVQMIQAIAMFRIKHSFHHAMHGHGGDRQGSTTPRRVDHSRHGGDDSEDGAERAHPGPMMAVIQ